eukprot:TRINITY_DN24785_c0_g1_i1.p1 TRINITY_DN24785_c0_g1~~TRINITY_DN24785_c0_g1_i1.p1  ORF type:complete len:363 (+),score=30.16 TRINITY_DN24785_c0_g1_i1:49-1089(+)
MKGAIFRALAALVIICIAEGKTLISYVYHRPANFTNSLEWKKCATRGKLCGCDTAIRDKVERDVPEGVILTKCDSVVCMCKGNGGRSAQREQCLRNLNFFLDKALALDPAEHHFLFNIVGETIIPETLIEAAATHSNIEIDRVPMAITDLCTQGNVVRNRSSQYKRIMFINCSARGPFFQPGNGNSWLKPFEEKISTGAHLVGPVINCWKSQAHVQSWVWYADEVAAKVISEGCICGGSRNDQIKSCELGVSAALLKSGNAIASLQPSYNNRDWFDPSMRNCNQGRSPVACSRKDLNNSLGCIGAHLCEEVFVKYGGNNIPLGFTPEITHNRVTQYDEAPTTCERS